MANFSVPPLWPTVPRRRQRFWNYPRPYRTGWRAWVPSWRIVVGTLLAGVALTVGLVYAAFTAYSIPEQGADVGAQTTTVYFADGTTPIGEFKALDRVNVEPADLPNWDIFTGTLVASEDKTFWTNSGVDPMGIVRAAYNNALGRPQQGGSTITQQYVEQYYDSDKSYKAKIREIVLAYKVTEAMEKDVIIERYLNVIYFGRGAYGIEAASQAYFNKHSWDLNYSEIAFLVGIIPSPNQWDGQKDPEWSRNWGIGRWERSIARMKEAGVITAEEAAAATFPEPVVKTSTNSREGYYGYLMDMVEQELESKVGISQDNLMTDGYKIYTTIDQGMMDAAMTTMALPPDANPITRASLTSIDPSTGAIRAIYGGPNYLTHQLNAATQGIAQGGSTFKPFTLIGALEEKISIRKTYDGNNNILVKGYNNGPNQPDREVTNFNNASFGQVDLIKATQDSINTAYVALNVEIGAAKTAEVGNRLGIPAEMCIGSSCGPTIDPNALSNVLGSASVHNIDIAHAYATIASGGYERDPYVIDHVTDLKDNSKYQVPVENNQVYSPEIMAGATYAMTQVIEKGSGKPALEIGRPAAGKTGTSTENKSAWFAGFVPQLVTVVGLYQDNNGVQEQITPFGGYKAITGGSWPVEAWTAYMKTVTAGMEVQQFPKYTPPKASPSPSPSMSGVTVPTDLVGQDQREASRRLAELTLQPNFIQVDSDKPAGQVVNVPDAGRTRPPGATIPVEVSSGKSAESQLATVPPLTGQSQNQAERKLGLAGLTFENGGTEPNDSIPAGMVVRTEPNENTQVEPGSRVRVIFSSGPANGGGGNNGGGGGSTPTPSPSPSATGGGGGGNGNCVPMPGKPCP